MLAAFGGLWLLLFRLATELTLYSIYASICTSIYTVTVTAIVVWAGQCEQLYLRLCRTVQGQCVGATLSNAFAVQTCNCLCVCLCVCVLATVTESASVTVTVFVSISHWICISSCSIVCLVEWSTGSTNWVLSLLSACLVSSRCSLSRFVVWICASRSPGQTTNGNCLSLPPASSSF